MVLKILMKNYQAKKCFIVRLQIKKVNDKEYEQVFKVWDRFEIKTMKGYTDNVMFYC